MKRVRGNGVVHDIDYSMPSKTDQSMASEVDVNTIMARAMSGKPITHLRRGAGVYQDISRIPDLMGVFKQVEEVTARFRELPSSLREAMGNDPRNFPAFVLDPRNKEVLIEHGLIERSDDSIESSEKAKPPKKVLKTPEAPVAEEE